MKTWISAWLIATACAHAVAQTPPPDACPSLTDEPPTATLQQRLQTLDTYSPACLDTPRYHARRGVLLQMLGQPAAAIEALEHSLLLDPNQPGTQLDYALALRDAGDLASAHTLLLALSQRTDLPPYLQPLLQSQLAATRLEPADTRQQRIKLSSAFGTDSNLNNASSANELTLTFPGGNISLPLAEASRARAGNAIMTELQWQSAQFSAGQWWLLQAGLRNRNTEQAATTYQQADLAIHWLQAPKAPTQWQARLAYSNVNFGAPPLMQSLRASLMHQWQAPATKDTTLCRPLVGLEIDQRHYPTAEPLDGVYRGLVLSVACEPPTNHRYSLQLRTGQDQANSHQRPGGNNHINELRATWHGHAGAFKLAAEYALVLQKDTTGYSPLLTNNQVRTSQRQTLRLELARPLPGAALGGAHWFISTEINRQDSNLDAFITSGSNLYSGLRWELM